MKKADLILFNGKVYTADVHQPWTEAVAVAGEDILFTGSSREAAEYQGSETKLIDLGGRMVLPGFFDSHTHASMGAAEELFAVDIHTCESQDEVGQRLKDELDRRSDDDRKMIIGVGWGNAIGAGVGPRKEILDKYILDIPVLLHSEDHHSLWVNSKALETTGITRDTPDPPGGVIEHCPDTGEPSGTLRESAMNLVTRHIPDYSVEQYKEAILSYQRAAAKCGITSAHEPFMKNGNALEAYRELDQEGKLTVRFRNSLFVDPDQDIEQVEQLISLREKYKSGRHFQTNSAKFFIDGVVEGGTAYLEEPYCHLDSHGELVWDTEKYKEVAARLHQEKFTLHIHSIGDASTRIALDGLKHAATKGESWEARHAITHLQLVNPEDIGRMKDLEVVAVPNPYWFMKEPDYFFDIEEPYLGSERAEKQYPMKSLLDAGLVCASASDYPVTLDYHPLNAIQLGVTRIQPGKTDEELISNPKERVSLAQMIDSFTISAAYSLHLEKLTGSIEAGKKADLIVLDQNLFDLPAEELNGAKVVCTLFEGKEMYRDPAFTGMPAGV